MMKKRIFIYLCILMPILAKAQILKDSTVQVVAYWNKGEMYKYKYYTDEYQVEGTDTIWGDWHEDIFSIEVVDSTENGYTMKYQCLQSEHYTKDKELQALLLPLQKKYEKVPIYFSTNQYGAFLDIARWDEFQLSVENIMTELRDSLDSYFANLEGADSIPENDRVIFSAMMDQILQASKSKESVKLGMSYIIESLYYHGGHMEQGREYKGNEKFISPWIPGEVIDGEVVLNVDKVNYETSWTTFHRTQRYEAGQLLDSFMRYLTQNLPPEQKLDLKPDQLPFVMVETFLDIDVHLNTGWPGPAFFQKIIQAGTKQKVKRWWLEMVFDE